MSEDERIGGKKLMPPDLVVAACPHRLRPPMEDAMRKL